MAAGREDEARAAFTALALEQREPVALEALDMFCGFLGSVAGNPEPTLGAQGGGVRPVFINHCSRRRTAPA